MGSFGPVACAAPPHNGSARLTSRRALLFVVVRRLVSGT
jgi:hypothetical protein